MTSSIPYDPDEGFEHNPFASESSPFTSSTKENEPPAEEHGEPAHDDADIIYGVATEQPSANTNTTSNITTDFTSIAETEGVSTGTTDEPHTAGQLGHSNAAETAEAVAKPVAPRRQLKKYKLTTKVTAIERQAKKDPIIRFDAYTTLPRFRTTTFRDIRRTHHEFEKFFDHLNGANPECLVPSVPPAVTSFGAGTDDDEARLKQKMQIWLDRVCGNPILARDEEMVYFIEADFGYSPVVKRKPPATGLARRAMKQLQPPPDEVTELQLFRPLIKRVYQVSLEAHAKIDKISKIRRGLGTALNDFGSKSGTASNLEAHQGMVNMWRKLSKTVTYLGDLEQVRATSISASFGDGILQVANDAYVAKEALTNRHLLMRELLKAQTNTRSKHQTAIRVKGSTNLSPLKVDEAINALEDATHVEEQLTNKVRRVSENMLIEKTVLLQGIEQDIRGFLAEYVLREIDCERRALSTWEAIRADVRAVDANGGLSRLGRESTPSNRRAALAQSQSKAGDSWSGDRVKRATDFGDSAVFGAAKSSEDVTGDQTETVVDARSAASLLAGSTF